jgi:ketosteroid isomerase-like protein
MVKRITSSLTLLMFLTIFSVKAQSPKVKNTLKTKIEIANRQLAKAMIAEDVEGLAAFYAPNTVFMPEYQQTITGVDGIKAYFKELFNRRKTTVFNKKIMEVIDIEGTVAEIGTFNVEYQATNDTKTTTLNGKYINIWTVQKDGSLTLHGESYGYFHAVDSPLSHVVNNSKQPSDSYDNAELKKNDPIYFELLALNALNEKCIRTRDGNLRADFYTQDAIFMPFADSMKVGATAIQEHLIAYNRGNVTIDTINVFSTYIKNAGQYVVEYPRFYVKWNVPNISGVGSGKGIRIWRRMPDCSLKMYREIGVHDHLE